jgi:hypothetical protein
MDVCKGKVPFNFCREDMQTMLLARYELKGSPWRPVWGEYRDHEGGLHHLWVRPFS